MERLWESKEKGERLGMISKYDCQGTIAGKERPNVQVFEIQCLRMKTPKRRAEHRGRKGWKSESAEKRTDLIDVNA